MCAHIASESSAQPAAAPGDDDGSSPPLPPPWPKLLLDSGASVHMVGDSRLLSNVCAAPAGLTIRAADGNTMPVTKIGNIDIQGFTIPDVRLVPGLDVDGLISVRQLARQSNICTYFVGDRAMLYAGPDLVGVAVDPTDNFSRLSYVLQYLRTPKIAAASSGSCLDGQRLLVPVWVGPRPEPEPEPEPKRFTWGQFSPLRVHTRKQLRLSAHMQKASTPSFDGQKGSYVLRRLGPPICPVPGAGEVAADQGDLIPVSSLYNV